jgi:hypothetical protein
MLKLAMNTTRAHPARVVTSIIVSCDYCKVASQNRARYPQESQTHEVCGTRQGGQNVRLGTLQASSLVSYLFAYLLFSSLILHINIWPDPAGDLS